MTFADPLGRGTLSVLVRPIQMLGWVSRPDQAFQANSAAAGAVLLGMTLAMNAVAIWIRCRFRRKISW